VNILKSYAQNKNRGKKMRLLGMDTCPSLNDIMEIRCNKVLEEVMYHYINFNDRVRKVQKIIQDDYYLNFWMFAGS
jgi:hypothetical protein